MDRRESLRGRTAATLEQGGGDTEKLATEWAMPFLPDDGGSSPTDVPFRGGSTPKRPVSGFVIFSGRLMMVFGLVVLLSGVYGGFQMMSTGASTSPEPKVFQVADVPTVRIENSVGSVRVEPGSSGKVEVRAEVRVQHISSGLAEQALQGYELDATQDPATGIISVRAGDSRPFSGDNFLDGMFLHRSVNLTVTMPANTNLILNVAAGRMNVEGITGKVTAEVNAGGLNMIDSTLADGSSFTVNAGGMYFSGQLQPNASIELNVNAGGAELVLPKETAARLVANADAGSVNARGWTGSINDFRNVDNSRLDGYLTADQTTKSRIFVNVHAGSAEIIGDGPRDRSPMLPNPAPQLPEAPEPPVAPERP